ERQIEFLQEKGVSEIHIVVGHLQEQFSYLEKRFGVNLIFNPRYSDINNIYSLYLASDYFGNSFVLEGDVYMMRNFLVNDLSHSTYFTGIKANFQNEWILKPRNGVLEAIILPEK